MIFTRVRKQFVLVSLQSDLKEEALYPLFQWRSSVLLVPQSSHVGVEQYVGDNELNAAVVLRCLCQFDLESEKQQGRIIWQRNNFCFDEKSKFI